MTVRLIRAAGMNPLGLAREWIYIGSQFPARGSSRPVSVKTCLYIAMRHRTRCEYRAPLSHPALVGITRVSANSRIAGTPTALSCGTDRGYGSALLYCPFTWLQRWPVSVHVPRFLNPFGVRRLSAIRSQHERFVL